MKILDSFFRAVLGYIATWLSAKKAERLETKVKQMESAERSKEVEKQVAAKVKAAATDVSSPSAWNKGAGIVILFCVLACGCVKYVESRWPLVPATLRPAVPEEPAQWTDRESIIAGYAADLEKTISTHNAAMKQHNVDNGYKD